MRLLSAEAIAAQNALRRLLDDVVAAAHHEGVPLPMIFRELEAAGGRAALRFSLPRVIFPVPKSEPNLPPSTLHI